MFDLAFTLILAAHLLLVDVAMAGPLGCLWLQWREMRKSDALAGHVGRLLARYSVAALALGIILGTILLALTWDSPRYFTALRRVPVSRLWWGLAELIFYFVCMGGYLAVWKWRPHWQWRGRTLAVLSATNLMYHFPPLFVILSIVSSRPGITQAIDRQRYYQLLFDSEVLSRIVHVWLASLATVGLLIVVVVGRKSCQVVQADGSKLVAGGARLALVATLLQLPVGMWVLLALPSNARESLMGTDWLGTGLLALSIVLALGLMHTLAALALGETNSRQVRDAVVMLVVVVTSMVGALRYVQRVQVTDQATAEGRTASN